MTVIDTGSYELSKKEQIIFVEAQGLFDEATFNSYLHDIKILIDDIKHQPWATLAVFNGNGIFTPEAEQALIEITRQRTRNNMVAVATVIKQSYQADLQQMQLTRIYQSCNVVFNFFSDEKVAEEWLNSFMMTDKATA